MRCNKIPPAPIIKPKMGKSQSVKEYTVSLLIIIAAIRNPAEAIPVLPQTKMCIRDRYVMGLMAMARPIRYLQAQLRFVAATGTTPLWWYTAWMWQLRFMQLHG